jgi:hypothetical protein
MNAALPATLHICTPGRHRDRGSSWNLVGEGCADLPCFQRERIFKDHSLLKGDPSVFLRRKDLLLCEYRFVSGVRYYGGEDDAIVAIFSHHHS